MSEESEDYAEGRTDEQQRGCSRHEQPQHVSQIPRLRRLDMDHRGFLPRRPQSAFMVAARADEADPHRPARRHEASDVPAYRFPQFIFPLAILPPGPGAFVSGPSLPCIGG
jgi:hypothetical protein